MRVLKWLIIMISKLRGNERISLFSFERLGCAFWELTGKGGKALLYTYKTTNELILL